jgi:hypothetical protein
MENTVEVLQREVQRKLGLCMLRLQQYERLLKAMVAGMRLAGPLEQLQSVQDQQAAGIRNKTLGTLVSIFTGHHLRAASSDVEVGPDNEISPSGQSSDSSLASMRFTISMSPERYAQTKEGLDELITLRNDLVHHFIERFDISGENGCRTALSHLDSCYERIDGQCQLLKNWATSLGEAQAHLAAFVQSKAFDDAFVHGINPDGSVC